MNAPLGFDRYVVHAPKCLLAQEEAPCLSDGGARPHETTSWTVVHRRLLAIGTQRAKLEHELSLWLVAAERLGVAQRCGTASLFEYASRHLGLTKRQTEERLRVGKALTELPRLGEGLRQGALSFSHVRELSRVATRDSEEEWLDWTLNRQSDGDEGGERRGLREVEQAVARRQPGELPSDPGDPAREAHRLVFEVKAETMALFRDLQAAIREDLGSGVDDDTLLFEIARRALDAGGKGIEGRAPYQVALSRCQDCKRSRIDAAGQSHAVDAVVAEMAECDGQHIGVVDERPREEEKSPHVRGAKPPRATQTIPPATRRKVLRRDGKCCTVPGCHNHRFLDLHHVRPRNEGGTHDPDNLVSLCGAHHRAAHAGTLVVEGTASRGLSFRHGDGSPYGAPLREPEPADVARQVFTGLVNMGFKQTDARRRVAQVQAHGAPDDVGDFLRLALRVERAGVP